jgi:hypothetical protein
MYTKFIKDFAEKYDITYREAEAHWKKGMREVEFDIMHDPNKYSGLLLNDSKSEEIKRRMDTNIQEVDMGDEPIEELDVDDLNEEPTLDDEQDTSLDDVTIEDIENDIKDASDENESKSKETETETEDTDSDIEENETEEEIEKEKSPSDEPDDLDSIINDILSK